MDATERRKRYPWTLDARCAVGAVQGEGSGAAVVGGGDGPAAFVQVSVVVAADQQRGGRRGWGRFGGAAGKSAAIDVTVSAMLVRPPAHDSVIAALTAPDALAAFDGELVEVQTHADDLLILVRHPRFEGLLAVPFRWPTQALIGPSTGEPRASLAEWAIEVAWVLDEGLGSTHVSDLDVIPDRDKGYAVVRLPGGLPHNPDD